MSKEDDVWSRWFTKRSYWPFTRRWVADDIEDVFSEMEKFMASKLKELSQRAPKNLVRERMLPEGRKAKERGPFVYGYTMTVDEDGIPKVREFGNVKPVKGFQDQNLISLRNENH